MSAGAFAYIGPDGFHVAGVRINDGRTTDDEIALTKIHAAVAKERAEAAAGALREAALDKAEESYSFESVPWSVVTAWLRSRAERTGKGEG